MRAIRSKPPLHLAQGLLMGAADVVPGVSGGTVALVVGIYERLIASIRAAASFPVALVRGGLPAARACLREVDWSLVLPLGLGIAVAIAVGSVVIPPVREAYPEGARALFLGLVGASVAVPWRRIRQRVTASTVALVTAAAVAFVLVGLPPRTVDSAGALQVAAAAAVAICAMILPGVSGAFLLEAFGMYTLTLEAVSSLDLAYIATFAVGAITGLGLFAKLLSVLLERWHDVTMAALTGLMIGALRALWPWLGDDRGMLAPPSAAAAVAPLLLAVGAFVALRLLLRAGTKAAAPVAGDER